MYAEDGDTIVSAATFSGMDPNTPHLWLMRWGEDYVRGDEGISPGCVYSVPNVMYFAVGDLRKKGLKPLIGYWMSLYYNSLYKSDYKNQGFYVDVIDPFNWSDLKRLSDPDAYGFHMAAHGQAGGIETADGALMWPSDVSKYLHHKLGHVYLEVCQACIPIPNPATGKVMTWHEIISENGRLYGPTVNIFPGQELPRVPHPDAGKDGE